MIIIIMLFLDMGRKSSVSKVMENGLFGGKGSIPDWVFLMFLFVSMLGTAVVLIQPPTRWVPEYLS
jgi:hypothetical protein